MHSPELHSWVTRSRAHCGLLVPRAAETSPTWHLLATPPSTASPLALGLLTFAIPALILLVLYIPLRIGQARRLRSGRLVYQDEHDPERRRLLAMRAAMSLSPDHLLKYSRDPIGDLVRGEHDALVEALLAEAGLAPVVSG